MCAFVCLRVYVGRGKGGCGLDLGLCLDLVCSGTFDQSCIFLSSVLVTVSVSLSLPSTVLPSVGMFPVMMLQLLWWQQLSIPNLSLKYKVQPSGKESCRLVRLKEFQRVLQHLREEEAIRPAWSPFS